MDIGVPKIIGTYEHPHEPDKLVYELEDGTYVIIDKAQMISADDLASSIFLADSDGDGEGDTYIFQGLKNIEIQGSDDAAAKIVVYDCDNVSVQTGWGNDEVSFLDSRGCSATDDGGQNIYTIGKDSKGTVIEDSLNTNTYYNFGDATQINDYGGTDRYYSTGKQLYDGYLSSEPFYDFSEGQEKYSVWGNDGRQRGYYFKDTGEFYNNDGELLGNIDDYVFINDTDDFPDVESGSVRLATSQEETIREFVFNALGITTAETPVETMQEPIATGGQEPTATIAQEPPAILTPEVTATATPGPSATTTAEPTVSATPTATATAEPTVSATPEPTVSATPEPTASASEPAKSPEGSDSSEEAQNKGEGPLGITSAKRKSDTATWEILDACEVGKNYCILPNGVKITFSGETSEETIRNYMRGNIWQDENSIWHIENLNGETIRNSNGEARKNLEIIITGTENDDTIVINNAENLKVEAKNGNDTIIIDGKCSDLDIFGDNGDDTIINNADEQSNDKEGLRFGGQEGNDTIINYGDNVELWGNAGADTLINYGKNVKIEDGTDYDVINDFGINTERNSSSQKLYIEGIDPKNIVRDDTAEIIITVKTEGNDCIEYNITYSQNNQQSKTVLIQLPKKDDGTPLSVEELQEKVFVSQDGVLCFDSVNNAKITGTDGADKILVQNSLGVKVKGKEGNDNIVLYNCKISIIEGEDGDDALTIINDEKLSKAEANTADGGSGRNAFFVNSEYATVDFGIEADGQNDNDEKRDSIVSYTRNVTLSNQDTESKGTDTIQYMGFDENGNLISSAAAATTPSSSAVSITYDPFGTLGTGAATTGTANTGAAYTNYTPFSTTGGTYSFDTTAWASNILANAPGDVNYGSWGGFSFDTMNWASNILSDNFYGASNFAGSTNYGFTFSSYDFTFGSSSGFNFAQNPITGLGLTSCTDAVRKTIEEAEAKKQEEEAQSEQTEK